MKNLNDLLTGRDAPQHLLAERFFSDARDEVLGNLKIDIRLEEREPNLPQRIIDVRFADRAVSTQVLEDVLQLVAELRKHNEPGVACASLLFLLRRRCPRCRRWWQRGRGHRSAFVDLK